MERKLVQEENIPIMVKKISVFRKRKDMYSNLKKENFPIREKNIFPIWACVLRIGRRTRQKQTYKTASSQSKKAVCITFSESTTVQPSGLVVLGLTFDIVASQSLFFLINFNNWLTALFTRTHIHSSLHCILTRGTKIHILILVFQVRLRLDLFIFVILGKK